MEERDLSGNLINSFSPGIGLASLAYEAATDTLWVAPNGGNQIVQLSTAGTTLQTLTISGVTSFQNNFGGEMPLGPSAPPTPEPGALALFLGMGLSGASVLLRRRRARR